MQFQVPIQIKQLEPPVNYRDKLLLLGSCFTEHIGDFLMDVKFNALQNPNGIIFDPISVSKSLVHYINNRLYTEVDLFYLNEAWHSWDHHSRFSHPVKQLCLEGINDSQSKAHDFLRQADWLIITLGSSFVYKLNEHSQVVGDQTNRKGVVANCHKAPAIHFTKHLSTIEEIITSLDGTLHQLFRFNPHLRIIFTVSPVRHIRDGLVDNNRSKARLVEAVHHLVNKFDKLYYFPAYELVIDVLRDYRFYDIDMVHPNYAATSFVLENFSKYCIDPASQKLMEEIRKLVNARNHKPFNPVSQQHKKFLSMQYLKADELQHLYPYLDFTKEIEYFNNR